LKAQKSHISFHRVGQVFIALLVTMLVSCTEPELLPTIEVQRVPENGIQPRIVLDEWGDTHLLYFRAEFPDSGAYLGHLYYTRYDNEKHAWQPSARVSAEPFNYKDQIYRANLTVGGEGRIHVVWFVGRPARFLYTRSDINKGNFETPRLISGAYLDGIDANADIASYNNRVALVWAAGDLMREDQRSVFMLQSQDNGGSFGDPVMIADSALGACACCALSAEFNQAGELLVAYRSAVNNTGRHMQQLIINQNAQGDLQSFYQPVHALSEWEIASCPVSTNDMAREVSGAYWLVYETENQLVKQNLSANSVPQRVSAQASSAREKHPAMAFNADGYQLIAWGEGGGFFSGGSLRLALFDAEGKPADLPAMDDTDIPDRSSVAVMMKPDGNFLVVY
jgi:hypothetical protein